MLQHSIPRELALSSSACMANARRGRPARGATALKDRAELDAVTPPSPFESPGGVLRKIITLLVRI